MSLRAIEGAPYRNFRFTKLAGNTGVRLGVWKLIPVERLPHLHSGFWQNQRRRFINHWSPGNVVELDWPHLWEAENVLTDIVKQYGWYYWKGTNFKGIVSQCFHLKKSELHGPTCYQSWAVERLDWQWRWGGTHCVWTMLCPLKPLCSPNIPPPML